MSVGRAEPIWFGDQRLRCFGMLHRPATSNGRGVVVCNSLGFEGLLAYRPFRHLAEQLVDRGFTVLRFDYAGTGDSAGGEWEPGCRKAWLGSIGEAVEVLRSDQGIADVQLVGFRIGATLAVLHAQEHQDISGLALWAPCETGKTYVRELGALARLSAANRPPQHVASEWFPEDSLEVVGFEFTSGTLDDLREIDITTVTASPPAPAAFVLDRDDAADSGDLVAALRTAGAVVDHERVGGYMDFVTEDETTSILPVRALDRLATWLDQTEPHPRATPGRTVSLGDQLLVDDAHGGHTFPPASEGETSHEQAVWISDRLLAIVSRPTASGPRSRQVVVLLNTGSANRAGPGRLHVTMARHWASLGFTVVRVDLGGAGDSVPPDPSTENLPYDPARMVDSAEVVAWVRRELPCEELTVFGVCSGAYNALRIALDGAPIDRVVLVNQMIFALNGSEISAANDAAVLSANLLSRGFGNRDRWKRLLRREDGVGDAVARMRSLMSAGAFRGFGAMTRARVRNVAHRAGVKTDGRQEIVVELNQLAANHVDVVFAFAADEPGSRYLRVIGGPGFERLVADGHVEVIEIDGGDHVFSPPGSRQRLIEAVTAVLLETDRSAVLSGGAPTPGEGS